MESAAPDVVRTGRALGSRLRLTVAAGVHGSQSAAVGPTEAVIDRAWAEIEGVFAAVDSAMSRFREDSEITRLHRARSPVAGLSRHLVAALSAADRATRMSDGRFDARVVVDMERLGFVAVPHTRQTGQQFEQ